MPYSSVWQQNNPYALQRDPNAPLNTGHGWSGIGNLIGRGLHALVPERRNDAFDPADEVTSGNLPYKQPGFFRALAGDRSNFLNTAEMQRGLDRTFGTESATMSDAMKQELLRQAVEGRLANTEKANEGKVAVADKTLAGRESLAKKASDARLAVRALQGTQAMDREKFKAGARKELEGTKFQNMGQLLGQRFNNAKTLSTIPKALDPSTVDRNTASADMMRGRAASDKAFQDMLNTPPAAEQPGFLNGIYRRLFGAGGGQIQPQSTPGIIQITPEDLQQLGDDLDVDPNAPAQ